MCLRRRGNSPDVLCRIIADKLSRTFGQQFVVENRPGAANVVGTQSVARAAPDGYTFLFATSASLVTNPYTFKNLSIIRSKISPRVAMVAKSHHVLLVNPDVKAKTLPELIALEKAAPGSLSLAVDGPRNISGLIAQSINKQAGTKFVLVPYNTISSASRTASRAAPRSLSNRHPWSNPSSRKALSGRSQLLEPSASPLSPKRLPFLRP